MFLNIATKSEIFQRHKISRCKSVVSIKIPEFVVFKGFYNEDAGVNFFFNN